MPRPIPECRHVRQRPKSPTGWALPAEKRKQTHPKRGNHEGTSQDVGVTEVARGPVSTPPIPWPFLPSASEVATSTRPEESWAKGVGDMTSAGPETPVDVSVGASIFRTAWACGQVRSDESASSPVEHRDHTAECPRVPWSISGRRLRPSAWSHEAIKSVRIKDCDRTRRCGYHRQRYRFAEARPRHRTPARWITPKNK